MGKIFWVSLSMILAFYAGAFLTSKYYSDQVLPLHLTPPEFNQSLNSGKYYLLDIRTTDEYAAGHLKNAVQNDYYQTNQFSKYLDTLNKNNKYLIYCRTGKRSDLALQIMNKKGFKYVSDLAGGYNAWVADNLEVVK